MGVEHRTTETKLGEISRRQPSFIMSAFTGRRHAWFHPNRQEDIRTESMKRKRLKRTQVSSCLCFKQLPVHELIANHITHIIFRESQPFIAFNDALNQDVPGRSREDLKKFISEVKHLRIILTERLHFRKPVTCLD